MPLNTETIVIVRSTDCGPTRKIQPHRFFTFFEQGRLHHLRDIGVLPKERTPSLRGRTFTIAETSARFYHPGGYPSNLIIRSKTKEVRNRSFILGYEIRSEDNEEILVEGTSAQVWLGEEGRPAAFSEDVRKALLDSWDGTVPAAENVESKNASNKAITQTPISVRYADLDGDEIINNAGYFVLFEHGRLHHLRETGIISRDATPREIALAFNIDEATCRFRLPVRYPDELIVSTQTQLSSDDSLILTYEITRSGDGSLVAEGSSRHTRLEQAN